MGKYDGLTDQERRKLYQDLTRAAKEIRVGEDPGNAAAGGPGAAVPEEPLGELRGESAYHERRYRRPRYALRVRIESYSYADGFAISGLRQYLGSLLSFLWPRRDPVNPNFVREMVLDNPYRGDPAGYSLSKTLSELETLGESLLRGGSFFKRDADRKADLRGELTRDLQAWAPAGYRLLKSVQPSARRAAEPLDRVRAAFDRGRMLDAFDLAGVVRAVYRLAYLSTAPLFVVREHIETVGELAKGLFKRLSVQEDTLARACARIDQQVDDFLGVFERLRWFARELYPVLLKLLGLFCRYEKVETILPELYEFVGLRKDERIAMSPLLTRGGGQLAVKPGARPGAKPRLAAEAGEQGAAESPAGQAEEPGEISAATPEYPAEGGAGVSGEEAETGAAEEAAELEAVGSDDAAGTDLHLGHRGILTILEYAFPGSRLEKIPEGDFSSLFWFRAKVFARRELRSPLVTRRQDFTDLLSKVSRRDPLAPVFVLYEIIRQMLESLNAEVLGRLEDPLRGPAGRAQERFATLRSQWNVVREELFVRYLKELDFYEGEASVREREPAAPFQLTPGGRRSVETINQIRNHVIRGYGHVATLMDRREVFRCPPLYALAQELYRLFEAIAPERSQLNGGNPIALRRLEMEDLVVPQPGLVLSQIESYIKALPVEKRLLKDPVAEHNRLFLEILLGTLDLLRVLLNASEGPLTRVGGAVVYADRQDHALRQEIDRDKTPLRIELRRDFEEVDQLTGLVSKSEYLRFAPGLFGEVREAGEALSFLVMDLDHFKAVNDTLGHAVGDEVLRTAAQAVLSTGREGEPGVRFGGDEFIVVVRGDYAAGFRRAGRIRTRFADLVRRSLAEKLARVPALMAQKELVEKKRQDPLYRGGLEELAGRWKSLSVGTLSIGVAQGLGLQMGHPCAEVSELFRRADAMLYLAKEAGGNRSVIMADAIETPLTGEEFRDFLEFSAGQGKPLVTLEGYVDYRRSAGRAPAFGGYSYDRYLNPS